MFCTIVVPAFSEHKPKIQQWPVNRGTINVVLANDQGIVALTDSMLTQMLHGPNGGRHWQNSSIRPAKNSFRLMIGRYVHSQASHRPVRHLCRTFSIAFPRSWDGIKTG